MVCQMKLVENIAVIVFLVSHLIGGCDEGKVVNDAGTDVEDSGVAELEIDLEWITLDGGTYEMGTMNGFDSAKPVHTVTLPSFEMNRTEITVAQYRLCVEAGICDEPNTTNQYCFDNENGDHYYTNNWLNEGRENNPVN